MDTLSHPLVLASADPHERAASAAQALVLHDSRRTRVRHVLGRANGAGLRHALLAIRKRHPPTWHGDEAPPDHEVALGFTYAGLLALHVPRHVRLVLRQRAVAFCEGAAARAFVVGDHGENAPRHWEPAFTEGAPHFVLTLHADDAAVLERATGELRAELNKIKGLTLHTIDGGWIDCPPGESGQWVHFGLRDGISHWHLRAEGAADDACASQRKTVARGELLLGHERDFGDNPWLLTRQRSRLLRELFLDGSFGVLRKIEQRVPQFEQFVRDAATRLEQTWPAGHPRPGNWRDYVKAKLSGRWPDGRAFGAAPWVEPQGEKSKPPEDLDFSGDPQGFGCPFGAHVRRLNPRSSGSHGDDIVHARLRVLARRGRPYGAADWEGQWSPSDGADGGSGRGLLGLFFCSSLEDQFEHLLGLWADAVPLGLPDRGSAKDPLIGAHSNPRAAFDIPLDGHPSPVLPTLAPFVRTRGMVYAFYPGRRGLQLLLENHDLLDHDQEEPWP